MSEPDPKDVKRFQEAVNHRLSGLDGDPWLAKRIIANEKGEKKMKRKLSAGLALALALICALSFALAEAWPGIEGFLDEKGITAHRDLIAQQQPGNPGQATGEVKTENSPTPQPAAMPEVMPTEMPWIEMLDIQLDEASYSGNFYSALFLIRPAKSTLAVFEEMEAQAPEGWRGDEEPPLDEKMLLVDGEDVSIGKWRGTRQAVECFVSLYSEAAIPSDLTWVYRVEKHTIEAGRDVLSLRVNLISGWTPEMFREYPLCLRVEALNLKTQEKQTAVEPLFTYEEKREWQQEMEAALKADEAAQEALATVPPPAGAIWASASPAPMTTAALHSWLFEKARENAVALWEMAGSRAYMTAAGHPAEPSLGSYSVHSQDFSMPTAMRLYTLSMDGLKPYLKEQIEKEENPAALAETMRYLMRSAAPIGNMGENAASETLRIGSALSRTWAYPQPGNVKDILVWLDFDGDYSVCCAFTAYPDGTVLCDSGVMNQDLPGGLFTHVASYEGAALELLGGQLFSPEQRNEMDQLRAAEAAATPMPVREGE